MKKTTLLLLLLFSTLCAVARQPEKGYRGFVDCSMTLNLDISIYGGSTNSYVWLGGNTTHGYQFNPHLFVGGGIGFEPVLSKGNGNRPKRILPVYGDIRTDLKFGKFTPFADMKLGMNFTRGAGLYFSPTIGYRFNWGRRTAINFAMGATFFGSRMDDYKEVWGPDGGISGFEVIGSHHGTEIRPTIRLGIEF